MNLTAREFALLALLGRNRGRVLSRTLIADALWDMDFDGDSNFVDVAIRRLRRKVDDAFGARLIQSVRGAGYVLDDPA